MKRSSRFLSLLLVLCMILSMFPTVVFAEETETDYVLASSVQDGDEVVIYNAGSGYAVPATSLSSYYLNVVAVTPDGDTITTSDTSIVWTVTANEDGTYSLKNGDKVLSLNWNSSSSKTSITLDGANSALTLTELDATTHSYSIKSATQTGTYGPVYLEYYAYTNKNTGVTTPEFTAYNTSDSKATTSAYSFQFYVKDEGTTADDTLTVEIAQESSNTSTFGHLDLSISTEDLLKTFAYGDIVTVSFAGQSYDFPICSDYGEVDTYAYLIRAKEGKSTVTMAINMGQIGVSSGLLEAVTTDEGSVRYQFKAEVEFPIYATITMKEAGGYKDEIEIRKLTRVNDRTAYPELTDEQFANFRKVTTTGMGDGALYRSSSPINPELGRNTYADAAAKAAGVKTFINLADTEDEATGYEGYAESYYSKQNHIFLGLPVAFGTDTFKNGLAKGFRYMVENEGPYLVHCTEGKDRAGLTAAILECLMGATAEEVSADYLTTYRNYYNVVDGVQAALTDAQVAYLKQAILDNLCGIFDVEDATTADLAAEAAAYMKEIGLTDAEIEQLKENLSKTYTTGTETETGYTYILHTNDVHGSIDGYAYIAAMKAELEAKGAEVILADAGDYSQGTTYVSVSKGATAVELMNAAGYDVATLGNHEFDYGYTQLKENMTKADFTVLCSDVLDETGASIFDGYTIIEKGGVKIGFFGLETPETQTKANPALIKGLTFLTETTATTIWQNAQAQVDALKTAGADIIVCLSHLGVDESSEPYRSYDLYTKVTDIDFIIDGHSHTVMTEGTNKEPIQSSGSNLKNIGVIKINNTTKTIEDHYLVATGDTGYNTKDETVAAAAQTIIDEINAIYGAVFAKTEVALDQTYGRVAEINLGDLITDAMLWSVLEKNPEAIKGVSEDNVIAITNGGGIRVTLPAGDLTMQDILTVLPFGNTVTVVNVTGAELLEALEASTFCTPTSLGGFPQVSGIKFTIDTNEAYDANAETYPDSTYFGPASINRVTIQEINGKAFDPEATYAVVTNNFCAAGGDTYYAFASSTAQTETGITLDSVTIDYITEKLGGTVTAEQYGEAQGRITVLKWDGKITIGGLEANTWTTKYGNIYTDATAKNIFEDLGFNYGDVITVKFLDQELDLPLVSNFSDVDSGTAAIFVNKGEDGKPTGKAFFAINMGNFTETYGIATKKTNSDGTWYWEAKEGVTLPIEVTLELKEAGGYMAEYLLHQLSRTNDREDYPELTDEQFANFREVTTTGMGKGKLYRSSSPINPELGRNTIADAAAKAAGVKTFVNLANNKADAEAYEGYADSYYSTQNVVFLNLGVDFNDASFKSGLATGFRFMIEHEGPYLVHCTEGKDRAGYVSALLECLMGATYEEVVADYMTTYINYYKVELGSEQYNAIAESNIIKSLSRAFGVEDLSTADLQAGAVAYLKEIGLSDDEIATLKANLSSTEDETVEFEFLVTSDLHGKIFATDYSAGAAASGTYKQGLTRISTYIKEQRAIYGDNLYTVDMGDTIQGEPLTWYYAFNNPAAQPAIKALRTIGYDMWLLGNHEFNYGMSILDAEMNYATSASTETEKQLVIADANYLDATTNNADSKTWDCYGDIVPYVIQDFDGVKVAIIGLSTPNIPKWDSPANWEGFYFESIYTTYKHYEAEMLEKADMIVVMAHTGINSEMADKSYDSIRYLVEHTNTIDLVFSGHEHGKFVNDIANSDGDIVKVLQPSTKAALVSRATVTYNKTTDEFTIEAVNENMANYAIDEDLVKVLQPYETYVWENYMSVKIGEAGDDFSASGLGTGPSAFVDLINKVQIWGAYDQDGTNTEDPADDTPAQLSITAPLTSGSNPNLIPKGDICLGDLFALYCFENWFYQLTMTGKEIRTWLEYSASKVTINADGSYDIADGLTYYDVIGGDGFSYIIDPTKPEGERIVSMTYFDEEIADDKEFTIVMNNYRFTGGGNYVKYCNEHGCDLSDLEDRIIYSTQFDMTQGEDLGQARALLQAYIQQEGTIYPTVTSTWSIQPNYTGTDSVKTIEVFETTDIHGYLLDTSSGDENTFQYRMARIAQIIKEARANEEIDDVILLDSGDIYQGTPVSNLTYGNALRAAMDKMGYDAVSLGNHEFDWDVKTYAADKDGTMPAYDIGSYKGDSDIPVLAYDLIDNATGNKADFVQEYTMLDKAGVKVAVIGYIPDYSMDIMAAKINPYTIKESLEELNKKVDEVIAAETPDVVIVLAHSSPAYIAKALDSDKVDLVCGGHSHQISYGVADSGVAYMQGNCQAQGYANTTITVDTKTGDVTVETPTYVAITKDKTALYDTEENAALLDAEIVAISKASWDAVKSTMQEVLGEVDQSIYRRKTIGNSTNTIAGNWLTGIMLRATADQNTMIAFTNSGGIRCDLLKDEDALTRAITVGDIYTITPFGNRWYIYDLTGAELAQNVNNAFTNSNYGDQFSGMYVTYTKTTGADGRPVRTVWSITLEDGTPVDITNDTDRIYRIVTNEYCATLPGAVTENMTPVVDVNEAPVDNEAIIAVLRAERDANGGKITLDLNERCVEKKEVCDDFTDIDTTKWYHDYVHYAIVNGFMTGTNVPGVWGIGNEISRAEIVQVLYALAGKPETTYTGRFTDVAEGRWFTDAVEWAAANGIVAGTGDGTAFSPEMLVDRQQTVTILKAYATYMGYDTGATAELTDYVDRADAAGWAEPALKWAVAVGLLDSTSTTTKTLEPGTVSTREVFATILYKFNTTEFAGVATIYFTNDVHGAYENYARLATLIAKDRDLLLDAGDNVEGAVATTLTKGQCMIDVMNAVGYDLATLGNHDFGLGFERFFSEEGTPYVSANFWDLQKDEAVLDAYKIFDVEGVKIAVVGITTPETLTKSTPAFFQDEDGNWIYDFCNDATGEKLYTVVQDAVDAARAEGADYVIALAHLGIDEQSEPWTSTSVIANTTGIDALIDGHSHSTFSYTKTNKDGEEVVVAQTGTKLEKVGKMTIGLESGTIKATLVDVTEDIPEDPEVKVVVDAITEELEGLINKVVATTEVALTTKDPDTGKRAVRNAETNLGDLCADAYRDLLGTDIAFVNGGGVRADIAAGDITYGDIISVHPFGNKACVIEVTGQQILDALELSVASTPGESGGFLQVSGITFTADLSVASTVVKDDTGMFVEVTGARRVKDVKVGGEPIDPEKTYTLGGHNYMLLQSGDGYTMFKGAKVVANEVALDNEVLIHYITETLGGKITADSVYANPRGAGRITILSAE